MKIAVLEPHMHGHRAGYVQWMIQGLLEHGMHVTLVTDPALVADRSLQPEFTVTLRNHTKQFSMRPIADEIGSVLAARTHTARETSYWRLFHAWYLKVTPDQRPNVVLVPYLDYCLHATGLLGSPFGNADWAGLVMRPTFHFRRMGIAMPESRVHRLKQILVTRALRLPTLKVIFAIDGALFEFLSMGDESTNKLQFLPQPVAQLNLPEQRAARGALGLPPDRRLVVVYGGLQKRKGIVQLLRALQEPAFPSDTDVLLAGRADEEVRDLLGALWVTTFIQSGRVRIIDRFIRPDEESAVFAAADCFWLGYFGHFTSSGILAQAACADKPVVACELGLVGHQTRTYGLGYTVNPDNPVQVAAAIRRVFSDHRAGRSEIDRGANRLFGSIPMAMDIVAESLAGIASEPLRRRAEH